MSTTAGGEGATRRDEIGREIAAALLFRGPEGVAEMAGTPFSPGMIADRTFRRTVEALMECARLGELPHDRPALPAEVGAAVARRYGADVGEQLRSTLEDLHGCAPRERNFLAQPGTVRTLIEVLADLHAEARDAGCANGSRPSCLLDAAGIFAPLPPVRWACEALDVAPGAPTLIAGYGFSGKTLAAQDLALSWATGTPAWGHFPVTRGRVLHIDYEQGAYLTRARYQRLARARGIDPDELEGSLTVAVMPEWYLDGDATGDLEELAGGYDRLIVDSFRAACPRTDENSSEARVPLDRLTRVSEQTGVTPVVIHHARKPSQNAQGGSRMAIRGSGALYDACGSVLVFSGEKGDPVSVSHEKARITGRPHGDFRLWIEDVELEGNATAGLRVSYLDGTTAVTDRFADLKRTVLELVRTEGTVGGVNAVHARLGGRKQDVSAAVDELVTAGTLNRGGSYHHPTLTVGTDRDC